MNMKAVMGVLLGIGLGAACGVAVLACELPVLGVVLAGAAIYFLVRMGLKLKRKLARSGNGPAGKSEA